MRLAISVLILLVWLAIGIRSIAQASLYPEWAALLALVAGLNAGACAVFVVGAARRRLLAHGEDNELPDKRLRNLQGGP